MKKKKKNTTEIISYSILFFSSIFPAVIIFLIVKYKTKIENFINNNKAIVVIFLAGLVCIATKDLFATLVLSFIILSFIFKSKNTGNFSTSADYIDSDDSFSYSIDSGYSGDGGSFDGGGAGGSFDGGGDSGGGSDGGGDGGD